MIEDRALGLFKGRHFDRDIIVLRALVPEHKLSSRPMAERGIEPTHDDSALGPTLCSEFEKRWSRTRPAYAACQKSCLLSTELPAR